MVIKKNTTKKMITPIREDIHDLKNKLEQMQLVFSGLLSDIEGDKTPDQEDFLDLKNLCKEFEQRLQKLNNDIKK